MISASAEMRLSFNMLIYSVYAMIALDFRKRKLRYMESDTHRYSCLSMIV